MSIESIKKTPQTSFSSTKMLKAKQEDKKETPKFDNKKVIGTLVGLAIAGCATVAILKHKKLPTDLSLEEFKKIGKFDKGDATIKGKPYTGVINVKNKKGEFALKYEKGKLIESVKSKTTELPQNLGSTTELISKKVYSTTNDETKITKNFGYVYDYANKKPNKEIFSSETIIKPNEITTTKMNFYNGVELKSGAIKQEDGSWKAYEEIAEQLFPSKGDAFAKSKISYRTTKITTIDPKTGEEIAKPKYILRKKSKSEPIYRKTENGITMKNGKQHAKKTITIDDTGNKIITVDYGANGKKVITITPDGKRTEDTSKYRALLKF